MKMKMSKTQWEQIGKTAGWIKKAQFDQEAPEQPTKRKVGTFNLHNQDDLDYLEGIHLRIGENILPHILLDQADTVEVWQTIESGHASAKQYILSFLHEGKIVKDVTINQI